MPGTYQYNVEIKSNVAKLLSDMKQVQNRLDIVEGREYTIKLNIDEKKLSNVISNLEKMLDSLGKGTGDFKQFENLSKELSSIVSEVQSLSKAFGKVDDSGAKTLLSSIQNIDKSLSELSQNILNVNKNMSNMGGNTSGAVKQVENITDKSKKAASALEDVAKAQEKVNGQKTNISSGLDSNVSKYQEIVSLVKEYYELSQKIQTPKLSYQKRSEDYDKIDAYLLSKKSSHNVVTGQIKSKYDREKNINDTYHDMSKGINEGKDFAVKAMKSAIQSYWANVTEMPSDDGLLSSRKIDRNYKGFSKEEYIIPKKYQDMEKSVIQETIAMNKNNIAYEEERKQIEANNSALKERMNLIRNTIKGYDKNPDYNGEYRMGLSLKSSDKGKTDIFSSTSSISQEEMLQEICNMLGVEIPKNADKAKEAIKEVTSATDSTEHRKDAFPDKDVSASVESATNSIKEENNVLKQNTQKVKENTQAKEQNANVNFSKYDKRLDSYNGKIDKYKTTINRFNDGGWTSSAYLENVQAVKNAVKEYETLLNELKGKDASLVTSDDINRLDNYEKKIKDTIATVTNMSASEKGYNFVSGQKELDKIHKLLAENSKMSAEAKAKIKAYYAEIESGNPSMSLDKIHGEILKIYNAEVEAGRAGRTLWDTLKNSGFHQIAAQMAGMFGIYDVINGLKQVASTVRELDTAYTEMRKVSNESAQSLKNFQKESFSTADSVGTTSLALQDATATWMRLGESLDQAKESAKDATVLLNVSEFENIDEATDSLVAMSQAYKELDKMEIIDVLDKIGNEYSISTDQLSTALKDSAAVLKTQGNDLAESVALITAGNAITQDASKTAGETLPERYRNIFYRTYLTARAA
jgi:ABC-type transporter Mla subunit MlaD